MSTEAVVIGASAGGLKVLSSILAALPSAYPLPVIIIQHRLKDERTLLEEVLQARCTIRIRQAEEKEQIRPGQVYIGPSDYHLLVEGDRSFSLSCDAYHHFSRPSIDVLFETAAEAYKDNLAGIILTGASKDGAAGIRTIRDHGGVTIAQNPMSAEYPVMPEAAIGTGSVQYVFTPWEITDFLLRTVINNL
jgi:two-component system, chemotaxis family, protein-glutamate methylesterase/glutaminase